MATAKTKMDALGIYLSGATSAGAPQLDPSACLGGYRSGIEARRKGFVVRDAGGCRNIRIDWIDGNNPNGLGQIFSAAGTALTWTPNGVTVGAAVTIANGETKLLEANTVSNAIRVTRISTDAPRGQLTFNVVDVFNDVLGFPDVESNFSSGTAHYRAAFLRNHSGSTITNIKLWLPTLGTQRTTGTQQLGGSGSGHIETATASGFADWPTWGWARIHTSGGSLREIVYYSSRTDTVLTVPSHGRARLGTSADAGSATDTIRPIPGIRIGLEAPSSNAIQTIADIETAPSGITWNAEITSGTGLSIASLAASADYGLWIHRDVPQNVAGAAQVTNSINIEFTYSAATYTTVWKGLYRVKYSVVTPYELYEGIDGEPDFSAPVDTSLALPFSYAVSPPGSGNEIHSFAVRERNAYDLVSQNIYSKKFRIDDNGALVVQNPSAPTSIALTEAGGGYLRVHARYESLDDDPRANQWVIYLRGDGIDPTGLETPERFPITSETGLFYRLTPKPLNELIGPFAFGQEVRALVRVRHQSTGAESTNTTAVTATLLSSGVGIPLHRTIGLGHSQELRGGSAGISGTSIIDAGNNIYWAWEAGYLELWANTDLIFRIRYDSAEPETNGFWTTYGYNQETITGTPSTEPVEVASWGGGSNLIYISANGVRRMKIDHTNAQIHFSAMDRGATSPANSASAGPVFDATFRTLFQVYDPSTSGYTTACDLDYDGNLRSRVGWKQRGSVGEFA